VKLTGVKVTFNPKSKFYEINTITESAVSQAHKLYCIDLKMYIDPEIQETLKMQNQCNYYSRNSLVTRKFRKL